MSVLKAAKNAVNPTDQEKQNKEGKRTMLRDTKRASAKYKAQSLSCVRAEDVPYVRMEKAAHLFYSFTSYVVDFSLSFLKFGL